MTIARYRQLVGHPVWLYQVELIVLLGAKGKRVTIAQFNCATEDELKFATECCDHVLKGQ